jgi:hypothetical protein
VGKKPTMAQFFFLNQISSNMSVKPKSGLFQVKLTSIKYQAKLDIDRTLLSAASQG